MKKKKYLAVMIVFIIVLSVAFIGLKKCFRIDKDSELSLFRQETGYDDNEKLLDSLIGKSIYIEDKKIWIDETNTGIDSFSDVKKEDKNKIKSYFIKDNKLAVECSDGDIMELFDLTNEEKKEIEDVLHNKNNAKELNQDGNSNENNETGCKLIVTGGNVKASEEIEVLVELKNNPGILGLTMAVRYDEAIFQLTDIEDGDAFEGVLNFTKPQLYSDGCRCLWDGLNIKKEDVRDGILVKFTFRARETAGEGRYTIAVECAGNDVINENLDDVPVEIKNGEINIK